MTIELYSLSAVIILGILQMFAASTASFTQRGGAWAAGPRDTPGKTLTGIPGRLERANRNFLETVPFFIAAVVIAQFAGVHSTLSQCGCILYLGGRVLYVPAYVTSIWYFRSLTWGAALAGIIMVVLAPLLA